MKDALIISTIILLPIILFIAFLAFKSRKKLKNKKNKMWSTFSGLIADSALNIDNKLILSNKIFAIDARKKVFIYLYCHTEVVYHLIQLKGLTSCVLKKNATALVADTKHKTLAESHINEVFLSFAVKEEPFVDIPVYDEIHDGQMEYVHLLAVAEEWKNKINAVIRS